ncbi:uncharacterized protein LOC142969407 [Anarhichas minor]|uniref:uncharacterized protein LOC142969407 n=1 Tax=Anarhichas minor TaxID=65739 RepID=UPI003F7392AE
MQHDSSWKLLCDDGVKADPVLQSPPEAHLTWTQLWRVQATQNQRHMAARRASHRSTQEEYYALRNQIICEAQQDIMELDAYFQRTSIRALRPTDRSFNPSPSRTSAGCPVDRSGPRASQVLSRPDTTGDGCGDHQRGRHAAPEIKVHDLNTLKAEVDLMGSVCPKKDPSHSLRDYLRRVAQAVPRWLLNTEGAALYLRKEYLIRALPGQTALDVVDLVTTTIGDDSCDILEEEAKANLKSGQTTLTLVWHEVQEDIAREQQIVLMERICLNIPGGRRLAGELKYLDTEEIGERVQAYDKMTCHLLKVKKQRKAKGSKSQPR